MQTKSTGYKILHFPLTRIVAGIIAIIGMAALGQLFLVWLYAAAAIQRSNVTVLVSSIFSALLAIGTYTLLYRFYENRKISELSFRHIGRNLALGLGLGALLQSLTILIMYLSGSFSIMAINPLASLLPALAMGFSSAIFEEILVRGIIFRIMEEKLGSYLSLIISALIFGALHLANPNSSLLAALGLALQAGLFLAVAYMYARNLWLPIAIHFAWNFTQAGIFGATVSGNATRTSLLTTRIQGPEWLTGGAFGPEGSAQATVFCLAAAAVLLHLCRRQNKIVRPYWKNKNEATEASTT